MRNQRRGFTLVEVLVISAVVAVLLALFLPAVAEAQEEARKNQCKNHLKQMGLAMHNYHDVHKTFPPGWVAAKEDAEEGPFLGWQTFLLPFMDQAPLYNLINSNEPSKNPPKLLKMILPVYRCPSDPMADLNPLRGDWATSSYSGNAGDERLPGSLDTPAKMNGILWRNSNVGLRDILDGSSNTFMMGERGLRSAAGIWFGVTQNQNENDAISDCSHHSQMNRSITSFSSHHPKGVHFAMCDGRVIFLSEKLESKPKLGIYQKLANRNDGQPLGDF